MFKVYSPVLISAVVAICAAFTAPSRAETPADALIAQCRQEAMRGHLRVGRLLPLKGPVVEAHRTRMVAICNSWLSVKSGDADDLLSQCLAEATRGPRVWHKGRDLDRDHVARLKTVCRSLASVVTD